MKLKKLSLFLVLSGACLLNAGQLYAQANLDSVQQKVKQFEYMKIYQRAIQYNDMATAASSLTGYLTAGGNGNFQDSLAVVYYSMNNLSGAYKLANELFAVNDKNVTALTLLADISGRSGETKTSLDWYEKLVVLNPLPYNYYQLATKQFVLERKLECKQSLQKVLSDSAQAMQQMVSLEVSNGYFEQVPAMAAAYNMLGVIAFQDKKNAEASDFYNKALAAAPKFAIAKQNLDALKPSGAATKPAPKKK